jgi:hypothetical protein
MARREFLLEQRRLGHGGPVPAAPKAVSGPYPPGHKEKRTLSPGSLRTKNNFFLKPLDTKFDLNDTIHIVILGIWNLFSARDGTADFSGKTIKKEEGMYVPS